MNNIKFILISLIPLLSLLLLPSSPSFGKENPLPSSVQDVIAKPDEVIRKVDVKPLARDNEIKKRLEAILEATTWYGQPKVIVNDGVVFLEGNTKTMEQKKWAEDLARKTQDVVAVVNRMKIVDPTIGDIQQQISMNLQEQWHQILRALPFFIFSLFIMIIGWIAAHFVSKVAQKSLRYRGIHPLLADVAARGVVFLFLIISLYLMLQLLGLTTIALTLVGGTGVIGIVLGIAFKNITENLLASILLSVQKPFNTNDLIEVAGITGYVQGLTIRATLLVTQDGYQAQIPNSIVYQSNILNFTKNPKRRESFLIALDSHETISLAQEVALQTLSKHPAILKEPEPLVLVDNLSVGIVYIRIYFWLNSKKYDWDKVKSSVIRLIKLAFHEAHITLPEAGLNLNIAKDTAINLQSLSNQLPPHMDEPEMEVEEEETVATHAEGALRGEKEEIQKQLRHQKVIAKEHNLLSSNENKKKPPA